MSFTTLSSATPVQIDTELAKLYSDEFKARDRRDRIEAAFAKEATAKPGHVTYNPYTEEDLTKAEAELRKAIEALLPLEAEYERRPWQRYWHVTNNNGHIHTSQSCSSCFPDTRFAWRTDLSGLTDVEVVEREAYNACTVCMPIAPAEQKAARQKYNKEQREAKAAERQAKKDAKTAKARERAVKHFDKVEKAIEEMGGREVFFNDYSLYGHDGRKSLYTYLGDLPAMVSDTLYALKEAQEAAQKNTDKRFVLRDLNEVMEAEARERGLIV